MTAVDLTPLRLAVRPRRRLGQLVAGLVLYGTSMAMMIRSSLGLNPWDVLHEGSTLRTEWSFGTVTVLTGLVVLLAWIPLRQRPGIGTVELSVLALGWLLGGTVGLGTVLYALTIGPLTQLFLRCAGPAVAGAGGWLSDRWCSGGLSR